MNHESDTGYVQTRWKDEKKEESMLLCRNDGGIIGSIRRLLDVYFSIFNRYGRERLPSLMIIILVEICHATNRIGRRKETVSRFCSPCIHTTCRHQ
jgi:hypothetical protein